MKENPNYASRDLKQSSKLPNSIGKPFEENYNTVIMQSLVNIS